MSQTATDDEQHGPPDQLRTVTSDMGMHRHGEMSIIGGLICAVLLIVALPLLPGFVIGWLLMKAVERQNSQGVERSQSSFSWF